MTTAPLTLPELLDALGYTDGENLTINHARPGQPFTTRTIRYTDLVDQHHIDGADVWYGVAPVRPGATGRGKTEDVTRLPAIWADLDIKTGGCPDMNTARAIIDDLSDMLTTRPVALTYSGHGIQPLWAIDDAHLADEQHRTDAKVLLRRFGRLVAHVADIRGARVDSVFDLTRILRAPGTTNHKADPIAVLTMPDTGHPITLDDLDEALTAYGITERSGDRDDYTTPVSDPHGWTFADNTCSYATRATTAWLTETPDARHPWLVSCYVRLAAMHRNGCITQADHNKARDALATRFTNLLADTTPVRDPARGEILDAYTWGIHLASAMPPERLARELGNHPHLSATTDPHDPFATGLPPTGTDGPPPQPATADVTERPLDAARVGEHYGPTEDGTARALVRLHGHQLRYCPQRGSWLHWDRHQWVWDTAEHHRELIKAIARDLPGGEGWANHKKRALSSNGVTGIARQAQSDPAITVHIDNLDADPYELNTPGGIIDLRTGRLRPPDPAAMHTRSTIAAPDFDNTSPVLQQFLTTTFGHDPDMIGFVQRVLGLSLIGAVLEQILPFGYGSGANGKSTLLEAVMHALGRGDGGYAISAPSEMLMVRKYAEHPAEIAQLSGARLVVCSELEDGAKFAEARIKQLTGRDSINARFMRANPFTFTPTHTFFLLGNSQPAATTGGDAFWRRISLIPFDHVVPQAERNPRLGEQLADDAPAVLAWLAQGAADYLTGGLRTPATITAATASYAHDQDTVGRFVEDRLILNPNAVTPCREIRTAYEQWCLEVGEAPVSAKRFGTEMRSRFGLAEVRTKAARSYRGAMLTADEDADEDSSEWWQK